LLSLGFEGFNENEEGLAAYIPEEFFSPDLLKTVTSLKERNIHFEYKKLEYKNWNEEWEKNFHPVVISGRCRIRASFHKPLADYPMEIIIEPKMAFGTGHHPTTEMIAEYLLALDLNGSFVFDMGCGSGILGILACKSGASKVEMADIDPVAVASARENTLSNGLNDIKVYTGGMEVLGYKTPDLITANISKSVLLDQMAVYFHSLNPGGTLVTSGILAMDSGAVCAKAEELGFELKERVKRKEWIMLVFRKPLSC
jgi:ribosomal protein L11 methyltransferase